MPAFEIRRDGGVLLKAFFITDPKQIVELKEIDAARFRKPWPIIAGKRTDIVLEGRGMKAYSTAAHFQFVAVRLRTAPVALLRFGMENWLLIFNPRRDAIDAVPSVTTSYEIFSLR